MTDVPHTPTEAPSARSVKLPELQGADGARPAVAGPMELIQGVKVRLDVSLGSTEITVAELFALKEGAVLALRQPSEAPLDILLDGRLVGRGQLVVVGDQFGVSITELGPAT